MLAELSVTNLGVIPSLRLVLNVPGMTALTGETGAGKTLIVGAIDLLMGGRADPGVVRPGADEAVVEGRFLAGDDEIVLTRVVPSEGRSRAYVDGRLATAATLAELGQTLVDLHGQHQHQSLLSPVVQRAAVDRFGGINLEPLAKARAELSEIDKKLEALGGNERTRAREIDLLRFQLNEITEAGIEDPDEDASLEAQEDVLGDAIAHQEASAAAHEALAGDGAVLDLLGEAIAAIEARSPFGDVETRARALAAEATELATDLRAVGETIEPDPERLALLQERRRTIKDLCRKYGDDLASVIAYGADVARQLDDLESADERVAELEAKRLAVTKKVDAAAAKVGAARRKSAPKLLAEAATHLAGLAMPKARLEAAVGDEEPADDIEFLLAANPGLPAHPLSRAASGGELSRTMLAIRLVLSDSPPTLVFDEVDAGVGGEAALVVGRSLAKLGETHQVLVVTHLPQVAAWADHQVHVSKREADDTTVSEAHQLDGDERVVELSRMLSGNPESEVARRHAEELLADAASLRKR